MTDTAIGSFEAHAPEYNALRRKLIPPFDRFYGAATEAVGFAGNQPRRILDLGAGTGLLALAFAPRVREVLAVDISSAMCAYLRQVSRARGVDNLEVLCGSADQLPVPSECADLIVSSYCFHHLNDRAKRVALNHVFRALRPGGRFVIADMMFRISLRTERDRVIVLGAIVKLLRKGPAGIIRILKNVLRWATRRWEYPAGPDWWAAALRNSGFEDVVVMPLDHEGGIAVGVRRG